MINKWLKRSIYLIALIAIAIVLIFNIVYINNINKSEISSIERYRITYLIISIGVAIGIVGISYLMQKIKIQTKIKKAIAILSIIIYTAVQIVWIKHSISLPFADSEQILVIAKGLLGKGELIPYCFMYLQYYPQQLTLSAIVAFIFKICNTTNYVLLQYINVISNIFTVLGLYAIIKELSEKYKVNKVLFFIITLTFIPIILLSTFVYGDFIGLAFVTWATYFAMRYTKKKQKRYVLLASIFMLIACLVRMNYFIFAIAIIIYWIIGFLENHKLKEYKKIVTSIALIVLFVSVIILPNSAIKSIYQKKYNLNLEKSFSTIPYLYMGISEGERGYGWYNAQIGDIVYHLMCDEKEEAKKVNEKCENDFQERIKYLVQNPIYTLKYYSKKIISMWAEPTMEIGFYNSTYSEGTNIEEHKLIKTIVEGKGNTVIQVYQKGLTILIFIGVIVAIYMNRKNLDKEILLLSLIFLGGFTFHLLWEAKSRYILPYVVILIPVATVGITKLVDKLEIKIKEKVCKVEK